MHSASLASLLLQKHWAGEGQTSAGCAEPCCDPCSRRLAKCCKSRGMSVCYSCSLEHFEMNSSRGASTQQEEKEIARRLKSYIITNPMMKQTIQKPKASKQHHQGKQQRQAHTPTATGDLVRSVILLEVRCTFLNRSITACPAIAVITTGRVGMFKLAQGLTKSWIPLILPLVVTNWLAVPVLVWVGSKAWLRS